MKQKDVNSHGYHFANDGNMVTLKLLYEDPKSYYTIISCLQDYDKNLKSSMLVSAPAGPAHSKTSIDA